MRASRQLIVAMLSLALAGPVAAQARPRPFGEGTEYFRYLLNRAGARPISDPDKLLDRPRQTVLILLGKTELLDPLIITEDLQRFMAHGGSVLIATDHQTSETFNRALQIRISGQFMTAEPRLAYRQELVECPLLYELPANPRHPIFDGLSSPPTIATNRPSSIEESLVVDFLAAISAVNHGTRLNFTRYREAALVAVTRKVGGGGRLLVIADHSIFINDMMSQGDNDNPAFAFNVARWLTDDGKRTDVLFYDDGQIQTSFDVSLEYPPPVPPIRLEELVPLVNEAVVGLERENAFNTMLLEITGGASPILRTLTFLLTLALVAVGLYRFLHARHRPEPRVPRLPTQTAALTPAVPAVERRHQAVFAQGNLAEAARELAHQAFAAVGVTPTLDGPPAVDVSGSWWQRLRGQRQVGDLWALAVKGSSRRVSPAALERLARQAHDLHAAVAAGTVRLASAESAI